MESNSNWKDLAKEEIIRAERARHEGNEGKARVCARRAVGHILGEFLLRCDLPGFPNSAYGRIQLVASLPDIPAHVREMGQLFLVRITNDHRLPVDTDLIDLTRSLAKTLLDEKI